jgi:hypothetical protein
MKRSAQFPRSLAGDIGSELIATGKWLDELAALEKIERAPGESDQTLRTRLLNKIGERQVTERIVSYFLDRSRRFFRR